MKKVVTGGCGENLGQFPAPDVLHRDMGDRLSVTAEEVQSRRD